MLKINIINQYDQEKKYNVVIKKVLKQAYSTLNLTENQIINVILLNDLSIQEMNLLYRHIDQATDVLSFENSDDLFELGDVFISIDKTIEQAKSYGHSFERELAFLATHGFLHCLGYDHLLKEEEIEMNHLQEHILNETKYKR
ncbi:MAG: rRNA maturation RNase YbeY [Firmicutes bacterium]|nr:rRNA maturation RNase YbeY [Bacillota bacterium]